MNTDFDALASLVAAQKLHPEAHIILSTKQNDQVKKFLNIYRDMFDYIYDHQLDWSKVTEVTLVDVAHLNRVSEQTRSIDLQNIEKVTIYDHHPTKNDDLKKDAGL